MLIDKTTFHLGNTENSLKICAVTSLPPSIFVITFNSRVLHLHSKHASGLRKDLGSAKLFLSSLMIFVIEFSLLVKCMVAVCCVNSVIHRVGKLEFSFGEETSSSYSVP